MKGKKKKKVDDYFYTCNARVGKIYVFWNGRWLNQLMEINDKFQWVSLNQCGINYEPITEDGYKTLRTAIEGVVSNGYSVYQLDTLEELMKFIAEES